MPPCADIKINAQRVPARGHPGAAHTCPKEARLMAAILNKTGTLQSKADWVNRPPPVLAGDINKA